MRFAGANPRVLPLADLCTTISINGAIIAELFRRLQVVRSLMRRTLTERKYPTGPCSHGEEMRLAPRPSALLMQPPRRRPGLGESHAPRALGDCSPGCEPMGRIDLMTGTGQRVAPMKSFSRSWRDLRTGVGRGEIAWPGKKTTAKRVGRSHSGNFGELNLSGDAASRAGGSNRPGRSAHYIIGRNDIVLVS